MTILSNMISNVSCRPVANQFLINDLDNCKITFQSYQSKIVEVDDANKTITVYSDWDYSRTTGKYRNQFMLDCGCDEMSTKKGFEKALEKGFAYIGVDEYKVTAA